MSKWTLQENNVKYIESKIKVGNRGQHHIYTEELEKPQILHYGENFHGKKNPPCQKNIHWFIRQLEMLQNQEGKSLSYFLSILRVAT